MKTGPEYQKWVDTYYHASFKITNPEKFQGFKKQLCEWMRAKEVEELGFTMIALGCGHAGMYDDYSEFLLSYPQMDTCNSDVPVLSFAEWLENGCPKQADEDIEYKLLD